MLLNINFAVPERVKLYTPVMIELNLTNHPRSILLEFTQDYPLFLSIVDGKEKGRRLQNKPYLRTLS